MATKKTVAAPFHLADSLLAAYATNHRINLYLIQHLHTDGRVKGFKPDVGSFLGYLIAHDAHHRGQISMLARLLGYPLPQSAMFGMWEWGSR